MLCPHCHGTRYLLLNGQRMPCPDCAGMGEIHCCDGLMEQPDPTGETVCPSNGSGANGRVAERTDDKASGGRKPPEG